MPRILLILSVVLIIAAAVFSVQTKTQVEKIVSETKATKVSLAAANKEAAKTRDDLKQAQENLASEKIKSDSLTAERNSLKSDLQTAKTEAKDAGEKLTAANAQVDDLKQKLADAKPNGPGIPSPDLEAKLKEAETKLGELDTVNKALTQKSADSEAKLQVLQKSEDQRVRKVFAKGLTGQVLAVNRSYNFIVISIGDKQGVVMNGEMIVKRGGSQVARVKITSVEPTTSIADVVPGSLGRGISVQAGDEVIYPGGGI